MRVSVLVKNAPNEPSPSSYVASRSRVMTWSSHMTIPAFSAEVSLYATSQQYPSAAVSAAGRFDSVVAQQLCRHLRLVVRRHRSLLLSGLALHGAARPARHLRAGHLPLFAMHPRPPILLSTPG